MQIMEVLTFSSSSTSHQVSLLVNSDYQAEGGKSFFLTLEVVESDRNRLNVQTLQDRVTVTIKDKNGKFIVQESHGNHYNRNNSTVFSVPRVSFDASLFVVYENQAAVDITITRSGDSSDVESLRMKTVQLSSKNAAHGNSGGSKTGGRMASKHAQEMEISYELGGINA